MFHLIMALLIRGVYTESAKCPEFCSCLETLASDPINATVMGPFDTMNISEPTPRIGNDFRNIFSTDNMMINAQYKIELVSDNKTIGLSRVKKCSKNYKSGEKDFFLRNVSVKSVSSPGIINSKEVRTKRTLKLNAVDSVNDYKMRKSFDNRNKSQKVINKPAKNVNKDILTYQIICAGLRDAKSLRPQNLPSSATKLIIQKTIFQTFRDFERIIRETPVELSQLSVLSVSDNVINQKPDKKYHFKEESVDKDRKKHSEFLPFASLQNPKLRSKSETGSPPKGKCKNLRVLNLVNSTITRLPRDIFHSFYNLQILNLSNNQIDAVDNETFSLLVNLIKLDVHNNRLQSLSEVMFRNLTKLLFLDVSQNLITNIAPSTFQYLLSLNVLNLANNPLSENQEALVLLGTGKRLQVVDISKTRLKQIPGTLERSVRVLNLMGNLLLSIRCGDLDSYSLLSHLNLRNNKISYVEDDALGRLEFLNNLQISENNLFQIPKSLPNNLKILNLSYNNIQNITALDFPNLTLLKELFLSYNQVSSIEEDAFDNLAHLETLDLSRNPILVLPNFHARLKLVVLNFSYFTNLPGSYSTKYRQFPVRSPQNVTQLNLESSPVLTKIFLQDTGTLKLFTNLKELNLRFTNLTAIRKDIFNLLPKLKVLKVEGNPWHCGKEIFILSSWLKSHRSEEAAFEGEDEVNTAHCLTPARLYKTTLTALEERDFENEQVKTENVVMHEKTVNDVVVALEERPPKGGDVSPVTKVNVDEYKKSSEDVKSLVSENKTETPDSENCCGSLGEKLNQMWRKNSTVAYLLPNKRSPQAEGNISTNEENKTQELNQNGSEKSETLNFLENKLPNSVGSEKNSGAECGGENSVDGTLPENESTLEKNENSLENSCQEVHKESDQTLSSKNDNPVVTENSNSSAQREVLLVNSILGETKMSRSSITKTRLPNKTSSPSMQSHAAKLPGELSGQPSIKNTKEDIKYWKNREQELLAKIAELEGKVNEKESKVQGPLDPVATQITEKLENDLMATNREKENYKNRLQTIEKELYIKQKEISADSNLKNLKSSDEIISHLKLQNEDLRNALAKMTAILRDKTTMCISQEKKIAALVNQVESLKEVVAITKDLLNIRNMEVQHLSNDISSMESKIECERQRHNQMLLKMDEAVKINTELKKEYENQLKLFQQLRDSYEEKILLLSRDSAGKKDVQLNKGSTNEENCSS